MSVIVKVLAALLVLVGIWVWSTGRSVPAYQQTATPAAEVSAAASAFDEEGSIVIDYTQGTAGMPFLLYTLYTSTGKPSVQSVRLVFLEQDLCGQKDLSCASNQPSLPVLKDEKVRIRGVRKNELVEVHTLERVSVSSPRQDYPVSRILSV